MSVYPKFLYSKEEGAKLICSPEEEASLKGDWKDTPAAFEHESKTSEEKPKKSKSKEVAE